MTKPKGVGRGRKGIPRAPYSVKEGKKLCKGPLHPEGGVWLPATSQHFFPRAAGLSVQFLSRCKRCRRHAQAKDKSRRNYGYVPVPRIMFVFVEIERRIGRTEMGRRLGWNSHKPAKILNGEQRYVEAHTAHNAINLLRELRASNVVRHRRDIKWGRSARGFTETRRPRRVEEFYHTVSDKDLGSRREKEHSQDD